MPPKPRSSSGNAVVAGSLVFFGACALAFPFYATLTSGYKTDPERPLSDQAIIRGAYNNTGSKDMGPDPNYRPPASGKQ